MNNKMLVMSLLVGLSASVSAKTPEQVLADGKDSTVLKGVEFRKGTIASLIKNVSLLNEQLKLQETPAGVNVVIEDMRASIPAQEALDVFNVFKAEEWLVSEQPGNLMAGVLFLQQFPQFLTPQIREFLIQNSIGAHPLLKAEIVKLI